jgi:hypothetical protein
MRRAETAWPERLGRSPLGLSLSGSPKRPHVDPLRPPARFGARHGGRLVRTARALRPAADEEEILQPAIDYARNGHPVHQYIQYLWTIGVERLAEYPGFVEQMTIDGRAPRVGELWKNPNLANTLERIAAEGREVFYNGDIARVIDEFMRANGGFLSYEDMAAHTSTWVEPVSVNYRGYEVWELPPNGQGIAALQMLNILERHDVAAMGFGSADYIHLFLEAKKLAFEDRARFYADPEYMDVSVERLLSREYAAERDALRYATGRRASRRPRRCARARHHIPDDRRPRRQHGLADPEQHRGMGSGHDADSACRTAASCSASNPASQPFAPGKFFPYDHPCLHHPRRQAVDQLA